MRDLDTRIRAAVDRTVSTSPPPVPVETIVARTEPREDVRAIPSWRWAMAIPTLAVLAVVVLVPWLGRDDQGLGPVVDVETTDAIEDDQAEPPAPDLVPGPIEITIEEGLWLSEIVPQIAEQLPNVTASELWEALDQLEPSAPFAPSTSDIVGVSVPGLTMAQLRWEGLLAPGTHFFDAEDDAADVIGRMNDEFVRRADDLDYRRAATQLGLTPYEVVVVASLVETADLASDADRAMIARVIHNRLAADRSMALDAGYPYAAQDRNLDITSSLVDTPGPYGLRLELGLPPTPISTPSEASLRAAIDPTPGPWLYYVLGDEQGTYYYATTLDDHVANVVLARENGMLD